jgi:tetratricopeptide (TPR) repeat protein
VLAQKATALGLSGKPEEALEIYESLCDRFPDIADGWYQRGVALTDLNRLPEAIDCYRRALALNPSRTCPATWRIGEDGRTHEMAA